MDVSKTAYYGYRSEDSETATTMASAWHDLFLCVIPSEAEESPHFACSCNTLTMLDQAYVYIMASTFKHLYAIARETQLKKWSRIKKIQ